MFQRKKYFKSRIFKAGTAFLLFFCTVCAGPAYSNTPSGSIYKAFSSIIPFYSSTDPIVYQTLSSNGEKMLICIQGTRSKRTVIYMANSNGTRLSEVFSANYYPTENKEIYFVPLDIPPAISGNGNFIAVGVRAVLDINRRNDFLMIYNTQTQRRVFFQLRLLIPGTNYVKLPENQFSQIVFSMDYNGIQIVSQIETGLDIPGCSSYDTALLISNTNGSNQRILVGPEDFSRPNCSFRWKDYPKSPHQPQLTHSGDKVVFYGQVFGSRDPYDKNGELFVINSNKTNLRQITFLRREDVKLETLGPFCLNYYGSRIFFKHHINQQHYISSVAIEGGLIQNHVRIDPDTPFAISGDGRKIFFIDQQQQDSLVYFDISREILVLTIDRSWSGTPYRYGIVENLMLDSITPSSVTTFNGNQLILNVDSGINSWLYKIETDPQILTSQTVHMIFEINHSVFTVNDRRISLTVPPFIRQQRAMIPLELFAQHFAFKLSASFDTQQYHLRANGNDLVMNVSKPEAFWNRQRIHLPVPLEIKQREVFIPASIVRDYLGLRLSWDNKNQKLQIIRAYE